MLKLYSICYKYRQLAFKKQNVRKQKPEISNFKRIAFKLIEDINIYGIINGASYMIINWIIGFEMKVSTNFFFHF